MNNLTDAGEAQLLTWQLTNTAVSRPIAWYVSLHIGPTTDAGPAANEVVGNGYARKPVGGATGFTVSGTEPTQAVNPSLLSFGPCVTADWGLVTHAGVWTALTGGTCLWTGPLMESKTIAVNDSLTISAGALVLQLDPVE
jgi:hypothetical protein